METSDWLNKKMLFKTPNVVLSDLSTILTTPEPHVLTAATSHLARLPAPIVDRICFAAGERRRTKVLTRLADWRNFELDHKEIPEHPRSLPLYTPSHVEIESTIRLLNRLNRTAGTSRGTVFHSLYAKISKYFQHPDKLTCDCGDPEWEALLERLSADFDTAAVERKLVIRRGIWGRVHAYTPSHRYRLEAYTCNSKTWKLLSHLPAAVVCLAPTGEQPALIQRLVSTSMKYQPSDEHTFSQLGRLAEYVYPAFRVYLNTLTRRKRRDTTAERKLVRRVLSPRTITKHLHRLATESKSSKIYDGIVKNSCVGDRWRLNPIKNAKFPREILVCLFSLCRHHRCPAGLIRASYEYLCDLTERESISISRLNFTYLHPELFELAASLCGRPDRFNTIETEYIVRENPALLAHLIRSKQEKLMDVDFKKCHAFIGNAVSCAMHKAMCREQSPRKRRKHMQQAKTLLEYHSSMCRRELTYQSDMLNLKY